MGGGQQPSAPQAPAPAPTVSETSAEAIQAQIDALPKILAAQKEYGSQFSEEQLKSLKEYAPQFAEQALKLEEQYAPQYKRISDILNPEIGAAQKTLTDFLGATDQQEYESLKPGLLEDVRGAQSQRGLGAISPLGSIDESVQLQRLKSSLKDRRLNIALSTAGRTPIGGMVQMGQGTTGTSQLVQNVSPGEMVGYQSSLNQFNASIFGTQANIFGTQSEAVTQRRAQNVSMINSGMSMVGSAVGGICWIAKELFGSWEHEKVHAVRYFFLNIAPKWMLELYRKHGEKIAKYISDKPMLKVCFRPFFEVFALIGSEVKEVSYGF